MFTCMNGEWRSTAQYVPDKSVNPITQRFRDLLNILRIQVVVKSRKNDGIWYEIFKIIFTLNSSPVTKEFTECISFFSSPSTCAH
jgi:hypothetical protein